MVFIDIICDVSSSLLWKFSPMAQKEPHILRKCLSCKPGHSSSTYRKLPFEGKLAFNIRPIPAIILNWADMPIMFLNKFLTLFLLRIPDYYASWILHTIQTLNWVKVCLLPIYLNISNENEICHFYCWEVHLSWLKSCFTTRVSIQGKLN